MDRLNDGVLVGECTEREKVVPVAVWEEGVGLREGRVGVMKRELLRLEEVEKDGVVRVGREGEGV